MDNKTRRQFLSCAAGSLTAGTLLRGMPTPKIKDVSVIATAPAGVRLAVVKIETDQDGLYGYGCATFTQRAELVVEAVDRYLKPFLLGRPTDAIEDLWYAMYNSSYWRNGPVLNNAISGVDQALWDIKGRQAGMPVYELLGGKCRRGAMIYSHAAGREIPETLDQARKIMARGIKAVRLQVGIPGMAAYGAARTTAAPNGAANLEPRDDVFEPEPYVRRTLELFAAGRKELGAEIELLHDVHERVPPRLAVQFAKDMEQFRLFFPGRRAFTGKHRLLSPDPRKLRHAARNGRIVQQSARVEQPHTRERHRFHPAARIAGGRLDTMPKDRRHGRSVPSTDRLARAGRRFTGRALRECHA